MTSTTLLQTRSALKRSQTTTPGDSANVSTSSQSTTGSSEGKAAGGAGLVLSDGGVGTITGIKKKVGQLYRNGPLHNQPKHVHFSSKLNVLLVGSPKGGGDTVLTTRLIKQPHHSTGGTTQQIGETTAAVAKSESRVAFGSSASRGRSTTTTAVNPPPRCRPAKDIPTPHELWKKQPPAAGCPRTPPPLPPHWSAVKNSNYVVASKARGSDSSVKPVESLSHHQTSVMTALARVGKLTSHIAGADEQTYYFKEPSPEAPMEKTTTTTSSPCGSKKMGNPMRKGLGGGMMGQGEGGGKDQNLCVEEYNDDSVDCQQPHKELVADGSYWGNELLSLGCVRNCKLRSPQWQEGKERGGGSGVSMMTPPRHQREGSRKKSKAANSESESLINSLCFQDDVKPILEAVAFECSMEWAPGHYNALRLFTQCLLHGNMVQLKLNSTSKYCTDWDALLQPLMVMALRGLLPEDWEEFADDSKPKPGAPPVSDHQKWFERSYTAKNTASGKDEVQLPMGWYGDDGAAGGGGSGGNAKVAALDKAVRLHLRRGRKYLEELPPKLHHLLDYSPLSSRQHYMRVDEMAWTCLGILLRDVHSSPFTSIFASFTETTLLFLDRKVSAEIPHSYKYSTFGASGLCSTIFYGCVCHLRKLYSVIRALQVVIRCLDSVSIDVTCLGPTAHREMVEELQYLRCSATLDEDGADTSYDFRAQSSYQCPQNSSSSSSTDAATGGVAASSEELPTDAPSVYLATFVYLCGFLEDKTGKEHYVRRKQHTKLIVSSRQVMDQTQVADDDGQLPRLGGGSTDDCTPANYAIDHGGAFPDDQGGAGRKKKGSLKKPPTASMTRGGWQEEEGRAGQSRDWAADVELTVDHGEPEADYEFGPTYASVGDFGSSSINQHDTSSHQLIDKTSGGLHLAAVASPHTQPQYQQQQQRSEYLSASDATATNYQTGVEDLLGESISTVKKALRRENQTDRDLKRSANLWSVPGPARYLNYVQVADANIGFLLLSAMTSYAWHPRLFFAFGGRPTPAETAAAKQMWRSQVGAGLKLGVGQLKQLVQSWGEMPIELANL